MAEINDDMDRTRATTAAKAAYEVGTRGRMNKTIKTCRIQEMK